MLFKEEGEETESHRKRPIPYDKPHEIPAIVRLLKVRHRQLAVKWAFGHQHLNRTRENLKEYTLSREKIQATEASLEQLLFLTASFFEDME